MHTQASITRARIATLGLMQILVAVASASGCAPAQPQTPVRPASGADCELGRVDVCRRYVRQLHPKLTRLAREKKLRQLLHTFCTRGRSAACFSLARLLEAGAAGIKPAPREAVVHYNHGCFRGSAQSCYRLGLMYRRGHHVQEHASRSLQLLLRSCKAGYKPACKAVRIGSIPRVIHVPRVPYPRRSRVTNVTGQVRLRVTIHRSGRVTKVKIESQPNEELGNAAAAALRRARFHPARAQNGDALTYSIRYRYTFRLTD